jgi:hypothetical protein
VVVHVAGQEEVGFLACHRALDPRALSLPLHPGCCSPRRASRGPWRRHR